MLESLVAAMPAHESAVHTAITYGRHLHLLAELDRHFNLGDLSDVRRDSALGAHSAGGEHAQRPLAWRGEEPEAAVLAERDLGDELVAGAEQPGVAGGDRRAVAEHVPLDDRLLAGRVLGDGH